MSEYVPDRVWKMKAGNGGQFASINRPTAGAREDRELPEGAAFFPTLFFGDSQWS